MSYLHCPRCRLAIRCRAHYLTLTNCPRCLARAGIASALFSSPLTAAQLHAATAVDAMTAPAQAAALKMSSGPDASPLS